MLKSVNLAKNYSGPYMKIIFMGSPKFAIPALSALTESPQFEVCAVYTRAPKPANRGQKMSYTLVHEYAQQHGIPVHTPISLKNDEEVAKIKNFKADIGIVVAYGMIIPQNIIDIFPRGCINIHPSLLPRWRGAAPLERAIMDGDDRTAVIIMKMDAGLDTGDILLKEEMPIDDETNFDVLHDKASHIGADLLIKYLKNINKITEVKQSDEGILYAHKLDKSEYKLDFFESTKSIIRKINALSMKPGAYFLYREHMIKILQANYEIIPHNYSPGEVIDDKFSIATKDGVIYPMILQKAGSKPVTLKEFLQYNL